MKSKPKINTKNCLTAKKNYVQVDRDSNDKTIIAGCPNFLGFWPFINVCSGYACIIFPKELLSDAKKDVYTSVKNILDAQFTSTCK